MRNRQLAAKKKQRMMIKELTMKENKAAADDKENEDVSVIALSEAFEESEAW